MPVQLQFIAVWTVAAYRRAIGKDAERGDVPGWVMVTIMTGPLTCGFAVAVPSCGAERRSSSGRQATLRRFPAILCVWSLSGRVR